MGTQNPSALEMLGMAGYHAVDGSLLLSEVSRTVRRKATPLSRCGMAAIILGLAALIYAVTKFVK